MALVPRIAAPSLLQATGGRFASAGPVATVDPAPLAELGEQSMVTSGGAAFRFENFAAENRMRRESDKAPDSQTPRNFSGLFVGSTLAFVDAFSEEAMSGPRGPAGGPPQSVVAAGTSSYEITAKVITNDLPVNGENLNISL